ncbi:MAG TPA: hypothetical protein VGS28_02280 [Candidatus Saccharimonadales bacterium]|nr:hypothetical protein [Candidatus Saccharimonadales bacterium]
MKRSTLVPIWVTTAVLCVGIMSIAIYHVYKVDQLAYIGTTSQAITIPHTSTPKLPSSTTAKPVATVPTTKSLDTTSSSSIPTDTSSQNDNQQLAQQQSRDCTNLINQADEALTNENNRTPQYVQELEYQQDSVASINSEIDNQNANVQNLYSEDQVNIGNSCPSGYNLSLPPPWPHITSY